MKALVLCAGFGTRLGDLTRELPKPMLSLGDHPLLAYLLGHLRDEGIRNIAVNLHFRPEIIRDTYGDGSSWGLQLTYSIEERLLGTAGALKPLEDHFRGEDAFVVQYGDVLTDQKFGPLFQKHREKRALATLLVHERARSNSVVKLDGEGRIVAFLERPSEAGREGIDSSWVNSGVCVCSSEILQHIPAGRPSDFPRDVYTHLIHTGRLYAVPLTGYRCAIDSPERLLEAQAAIVEGRCRIEPLRAEAFRS